MPSYKITWVNNKGENLEEFIIYRQRLVLAIRAAALRMRNSPWLQPKETCGFFVDWATLNDKIQEPENI